MGITDGSVYCGWCGEDRTSCSLCGGLAPLVGPDTRYENAERQNTINERQNTIKWLGDKGYKG